MIPWKCGKIGSNIEDIDRSETIFKENYCFALF